MKIFHVSAREDGKRGRFKYLGYDTYSDFVVVCETEDQARNIHPSGRLDEWERIPETKEDLKYGTYLNSWIRRSDIPFLTVVEIGTSVPGIASGTIICSSYHAG